MSTIRSSFTPDGQRLYIDEVIDGRFRVCTRWRWITPAFDRLTEAIAAFEVLEFCEGDLYALYRSFVHLELQRTPANAVAGPAMARTAQVLADIERRKAGLVPIACGSKSSCIKWVPAKTSIHHNTAL